MAYLKFLAVAILVVSAVWFVKSPDFEPALAFLGSVSALASMFFVENRNEKRARQQQSVSQSSMGIQAGGDINISNTDGSRNAK